MLAPRDHVQTREECNKIGTQQCHDGGGDVEALPRMRPGLIRLVVARHADHATRMPRVERSDRVGDGAVRQDRGSVCSYIDSLQHASIVSTFESFGRRCAAAACRVRPAAPTSSSFSSSIGGRKGASQKRRGESGQFDVEHIPRGTGLDGRKLSFSCLSEATKPRSTTTPRSTRDV